VFQEEALSREVALRSSPAVRWFSTKPVERKSAQSSRACCWPCVPVYILVGKMATVRNCLMPGFQHYVRYIRFRDRFRNPCPHCHSVAPLLFPYRDANGYGINPITRSYMNGNGERNFLRKLLNSYG